MTPLLSIIVPIYNMQDYLAKCIESILSQSFRNYELVLVNDGSNDKSADICEKYANEDKRIRVITKQNGGLSDARNSGIEASNGNYIAFVDADDWIDSGMFDLLIKIAIEKDADIVCCKYQKVTLGETVGKKKAHLGKIDVYNNEQALISLYTDERISFIVCDKIYKSELFFKIKFEKGIILEDVLILPQLFFNAKKIISIDAPYYYYLQRPDSIISSGLSISKLESSMYVFQKNMEYFREKSNVLYFHAEKMFCSALINWCIRVDRQCKSKKEYNDKIRKLIRRYSRELIKNSIIDFKWKVLLILAGISMKFIILYGRLNSCLSTQSE